MNACMHECIHNTNEYYFTPTLYVVDILLGCGGSGSCSTLVTGGAPEAVEDDNNIIIIILHSKIHFH